MSISDPIRNGILNELTSSELLEIAVANDGYTTMQDMGRDLMLQGEISAQEYQRVLLMN